MKTILINKIFLLIAASSILGFFGLINTVQAATSVTRDSITWTFDGDYVVGQFVTGDWYVVAPSGVSITTISANEGKVLIGSMLNPASGGGQGYYDDGDSESYSGAGYESVLNVGLNIPLSLSVDDMLVSATHRPYFGITDPGNEKNYTDIDEAAILTVLASIPLTGSFRPALHDSDRTIYNESNINYNLLANLVPVSGAPSLTVVADRVARPWIDHRQGWTGRMIHPHNNMRDYGAEITADVSTVALIVNSNYTQTEKRPIVIGLIQIGLDLYSNINNVNNFYQHVPGHINGRKFPVLFAGEMLNIAEIKAIWPKTGQYLHVNGVDNFPADAYLFAEDSSIAYVDQEWIDLTNSSSWTPGRLYEPFVPLSQSHLGMAEWMHYGPEDMTSHWTADGYRRCCSQAANLGISLSVMAMGLQGTWNHPAYFDYIDRYMAIASGNSAPNGYVVEGETTGYAGGIYGSGWAAQMWNTYRQNYDSANLQDPTCYDNIQNQGETGIDCGGPCNTCPDPEPNNCYTSNTVFQNSNFQTQSGNFIINFNITPSAANIDSVIGLSDIQGSTWSDYAAIVRFNGSGFIDVRSGSSYLASLTYSYISGHDYYIEMDVDMINKTYDVFVTYNDIRTQIANNYNFRTEKQDINQFDYLGTVSTSGSCSVCDINIDNTNQETIRADVNQDSQINTTDAMLILRNSLGLSMTGTAWQSSATTGDVNCDGSSNSTDAMLILRYSLGLNMSGIGWCE